MAFICSKINLLDVPSKTIPNNTVKKVHEESDWDAARKILEEGGLTLQEKPETIDFMVDGPGGTKSRSIDPYGSFVEINETRSDLELMLEGLEYVSIQLEKSIRTAGLGADGVNSIKENKTFFNDEGSRMSAALAQEMDDLDRRLYRFRFDKSKKEWTTITDASNAPQKLSEIANSAFAIASSFLKDIKCDTDSFKKKIIEQYEKAVRITAGKNSASASPKTSYEDIKKAASDPKVADALGLKIKNNTAARAAIAKQASDALFSEAKSFREQCIMLATIFQLVPLHVASFSNKKLPFLGGYEYNASLPVEGEPFGFINKLTQSPSFRNFFEAENDQLAHLQPMIRLFKVAPDKKGNEVELEFPFETFASKDDVSEIYSNRNKRGFGANIKNFTFAYDGSNPFSVKKSIKAKLSIKANNFSELLKIRGNSGLRYIDLALKTGKAVKEKTGDPELDFRIKALIGLSLPPKSERIKNYSQIQGAVNDNFVTLNLTPVTHQFDFDETGAVSFTIDYYAYIEEYFDKPRMNIFSDTSINKRLIERDLAFKTLVKDCGGDNSEKISEFKQQESEKIKSDKLDALKFLTSKMLGSGILHYLNLTPDEFNDIAEKGPFFKIGDITSKVSKNSNAASSIAADLQEAWKELEPEEVEEVVEDKTILEEAEDFVMGGAMWGIIGRGAVEGAEWYANTSMGKFFTYTGASDTSKSARPISPQNKTIAFFFLGDLIDLILKEMQVNFESLTLSGTFALQEGSSIAINQTLLSEEKKKIVSSIEQLKKMRIVLGPMKLINHADTNQSANISFADLPISLSYFNEWLTEKMLAKDSAEYTLTQFINNLMNNFVKTFLNDDSCYDFNIKQKIRVFQSTITSYRQANQGKIDDITKQMNMTTKRLYIDKASRPVLNISGHRSLASANLGADKENHFFIFYAGRTTPSDMMVGNKKNDEKGGIYHYILGRDVGIVKNISLSKTDSPGLKEVRFEQEGYQGLTQLREIYDVSIDSFLNVHAFPGTYIFVEPRGFSPNLGKYDKDGFDLTDLGIGGYHMIIGSEHEIAPGTMKSTLRAKWVQGLDAENKDNQNSSTSPKKCKSIY
jgi:hypothetical protein